MEASVERLNKQVGDEELDLRELMAALWAGKRQIIACVLLSAIISVAFSLYQPNKYTAKAVLAPRSGGGGGSLAQLAAQYGVWQAWQGSTSRILEKATPQ